jgi:gluconate 2-dehydrogenase gamma chain
MEGPFEKGVPEQGDQSPLVPRQRYRLGIAALNKYCQTSHQKAFKDLTAGQQDDILHGLENGKIALDGYDSASFFAQVLTNAMEGFFADPIYGGNKDMVSWKMLGFPGARYDYRDYIGRHNQDLKLQPVSIADLPTQKKGS